MKTSNRRQFLTTSGAAALSTYLGSLAANAQGDLKTKPLKVGIVGLGSRGNGAVRDILNADPNVILWAVGDIDEKTTNSKLVAIKKHYGKRVQCEGRSFFGYDSFDKVSSSGLDVILLTTPPAFRPVQVKRSFEKGLHVFAEKPWCVDTPGLNLVKDAVEAANKKGLSFLTGLVWRHTPGAQKLYQTALSGELGDIVNAQGYYCLWRGNHKNASPLDPAKLQTLDQFNRGDMWTAFSDLSGDWILEQFIHTVDKLGWAMNDETPKRCYGVGGRNHNYAIRNTSKQFNITYEYDDGRRAYLNGSHVSRFSTIHDEVFATKGMTHLSNGRSYIKKEGKIVHQVDSVGLGYKLEHETFLKHIRAGEVYTDIKSSYNTHLLALMGRLAAYSGQDIYPDDVFESEEVFFDSEKKWESDSPFKSRPFASPLNYKF